MKGFKYILLLVALSACNSSVKNGSTDTLSRTDSAVSLSPMAEVTLFDKPVAIVVTPSERLAAQMKGKMEGGEYNAFVSDNGFYMTESVHYLDSVKAYKVNRESEGVVKFKTAVGKTFEMKLDTLFFGVLLFNGKDKPVVADMTALKQDYERYMKK